MLNCSHPEQFAVSAALEFTPIPQSVNSLNTEKILSDGETPEEEIKRVKKQERNLGLLKREHIEASRGREHETVMS